MSSGSTRFPRPLVASLLVIVLAGTGLLYPESSAPAHRAYPAAAGEGNPSPTLTPVTGVRSLVEPSWTMSSVCGATTHAGRVQPGPACAPNPPDVIPTSVAQGAISATSPTTGQVVFWDSGWENHPGNAYQQTWEYLNGTWTNDMATTGTSHPNPEPNAEVGCMTWDPLGGFFLALSGMTTLGATGGVTWEFSNHQWSNLSIDIPDFGGTCAMAWDYADNEAVAYFPNAAFSAAYTYVWSGEGWNDVTNSSGTPSLGCVAGNGMAWDAFDRKVVSFGGELACSTNRNVNWTWGFSGGVWTNLTTGLVPEPPAGSFDEIAGVSGGVLLMTEGSTVNTAPEFWFFGNRTWSSESISGGVCQRNGGIMGAVNATDAFLFGGDPIATSGSAPCHWSGGGYFNDSWEFSGVPSLLSGGGSGGSTGPPPANGTASHSAPGGRGGLSCSSVILSWSNPPPPPAETLVNVTVRLHAGPGNASPLVAEISTNGPSSSVQVNGLRCGSMYSFQVRAWFSSGLASPLSGVFGFHTEGAVVPAPTSCAGCGSGSDLTAIALVVAIGVVVSLALLILFARDRGRSGGAGRRIG